MPKRLTYGFVKEQFEKEGYMFVSTEYKNNYTKLEYICPVGHQHSIIWGAWQQGNRCRKCANKRISESKIGKKNHNFGKLFSKETRQKMSIARSGESNPMFGKNRPEISERMFGENNPNWKGGISCEPYCQVWTDEEFKQAIRDRDNNINQDIGYWHNGGLSIHHIDYDKKNCHPSNLITVSRGMNAAANFDREFYTDWFQTLMNHRFGYTYN